MTNKKLTVAQLFKECPLYETLMSIIVFTTAFNCTIY